MKEIVAWVVLKDIDSGVSKQEISDLLHLIPEEDVIIPFNNLQEEPDGSYISGFFKEDEYDLYMDVLEKSHLLCNGAIEISNQGLNLVLVRDNKFIGVLEKSVHNQSSIVINQDSITILDAEGKEIVHWIQDEWVEDSTLVPSIANAVHVLHTQGVEYLKNMIEEV
ncbi:hypothetical protein PaeCFBP13512_22210 [Paenibacillus sp. CFBP13512]|uniref:hypothetical protein n=1 Tax=Paenibacillus sp. CFBP13512 TaxID=2184007 RepID=UPI0010C124EC|nr:hypothetical protein [Paenibacillus sp. CFBP13512]TKJ83837.1 hypothetical protein PaeCFBP13512_22210 [Paenibacillus sp. CFBP13512]